MLAGFPGMPRLILIILIRRGFPYGTTIRGEPRENWESSQRIRIEMSFKCGEELGKYQRAFTRHEKPVEPVDGELWADGLKITGYGMDLV
jgi:hypothetical protein